MKKRKIKFDKVFAITVIFIIIASLTACDKVQNKIDEKTTEPITTTKSTTTMATTTTEAETTETTTTKATTITTTIKATTATKPTTTKSTTKKVTTTQKETTTKKAVPTEYDRLLSKLKEELSKKSFDEEVNKLFFEVFEQLYKNYPTWQKGYKDLPAREDYIKSNLINIIKSIDKVIFYREGSKEAIELDEEGYSSAWTTFDEDRNLKIGFIAKEADKADEEERNRDIECFYHEITHCKQENLMDYVNEYFYGNEEVEQLYLEGGATFHMKFTNPFSLDVGGIWSIENEKRDISINYNKDNGSGYLIDLNAYEKLVYLVGYNTMDKVEKGEIPISAVKDTIAKKYGEKQADEFLQIMKDWYTEYLNSYKGEKIYNLAIELENQFLDFIKQDIESLKTREEAKKYKPIYEFYIQKNLPQIEDTNAQPHKDLTREIFDVETLDKMLEEKLK